MRSVILLFIFLLSVGLNAQTDRLTDVVWSFDMTYEISSGLLIEQADPKAPCDLLLNSDNSFELLDGDEVRQGSWKLENEVLFLPFRGANRFDLAFLSSAQLELRFKIDSKYYIHRFRSQSAPASTAPPITSAPAKPSEGQSRTWLTGDRTIRIELTGGGFFSSNNPVQRDYILIKENGRLIHERKMAGKEAEVVKKTLSQRQLAEVGDYIRSAGFFQMEGQYECLTDECKKRLLAQPKPIPLRLAVTDGLDRHVVEVPIWPDNDYEEAWVDYPAELKQIVEVIRSLSE